MSEEEQDKLFEEMKRDKNRHVLHMANDLYKTTNFILVTDKSCAMSGKLEDIFLLIHKELEYLVSNAPQTKSIWAEYFRDIANQLEE